MARKSKGVQSRKFGAPLYCAAWPVGPYPLVGGGGGKRSSGIPNRVMLLEVAEHALLDQERGSLKTDEVTPFNMAVHPAGRSVVLGLGSAGIRVLDLQEAASGPPTLAYAEESEAQQAALHGIGEPKGLAFSVDGRLIAIGDLHSVHIFEWPSLMRKASIRREHGLTDTVRDLDFSRAHANNAVLATACEDGSCSLWHWSDGTQIDQLQLPADLKGGTFKACRFARDGRLGLFSVVNHQGRGHILYWSQSDLGELMLANQTRANCFSAPITAFDISAKGNFLGTGTSEGDVATFSSRDLQPLQKVKGAHMVFTTALAFSTDEKTMLTVSADASALATQVSTRKAGSTGLPVPVLIAVIVAVVAILWFTVLSRLFSGHAHHQPNVVQNGEL